MSNLIERLHELASSIDEVLFARYDQARKVEPLLVASKYPVGKRGSPGDWHVAQQIKAIRKWTKTRNLPRVKALSTILFDSRPRDNTGQYAPQQAGGVDPMAMRQAYEHIRRQEAAKKQATWGAVKRGVMTAGLMAGTGLIAHKVGKNQGMSQGVKQGAQAGFKRGKVLAKKVYDRYTKEKEGLGAVIARAQREVDIRKDVERDHLAEIRRLTKKRK